GFALVCCAAVASGAARAGDTCCGPPIQAGYPSWSPDGSTIAFQFKDDVWLARPDGGGLRALTQDGRGREPVWSPDGRRIAFVRINFSFQTDGGLYVVNADGSGARRIAEARTEPPSWSPDGSRVAYVGPG